MASKIVKKRDLSKAMPLICYVILVLSAVAILLGGLIPGLAILKTISTLVLYIIVAIYAALFNKGKPTWIVVLYIVALVIAVLGFLFPILGISIG